MIIKIIFVNTCSFLLLDLSAVDAIISSKASLSVHGEHPMDLRVTQSFSHPDPAMLAPRPPFFLGPLTSQHCSQFSQQQLQLVRKLCVRVPFFVFVWMAVGISYGYACEICFMWARVRRTSERQISLLPLTTKTTRLHVPHMEKQQVR